MRPNGRVRLATLLLGSSVAVACARGEPGGVPYLDDDSFRRAEMTASLANPADGYAELRLARYASGNTADWERLPEWNPSVDVLGTSELDAPGGASTTTLSENARPLTLPLSVASEDDPALVELGRQAFARYPVQLASYLSVALASRQAATRYGLWTDDVRGIGGLVRARMADGSGAIALTCSTCHASIRGGVLVDGTPNAQLDLGAAMLDAATGPVDPAAASAIAAWGPGRLDVTMSSTAEPARIPDLRPVRWLSYLQQDATVIAKDRTALAIRTETLIVTSQNEVLRPPRVVALAIAAYVASLADGLPSADEAAGGSPRGAEIFAARCTSCHVPPAFTGPPVALSIIGTDPTLGLSPERGTGHYRVPSLHGVGTRGPLLHDGTVPSVDAMLDPTRTTAEFTQRLHGAGAVPGHVFGLDLEEADRTAILTYLRAL